MFEGKSFANVLVVVLVAFAFEETLVVLMEYLLLHFSEWMVR